MNKKINLKKVIIISIIIISLIMPLNCLAHSGRTDSSGGHKDNKNASGLGPYHYHCGGHPAHLHDGGVCPYSATSATSSTPVETSTQTPAQTTTTKSKTNESSSKAKSKSTEPQKINVQSLKFTSNNIELIIGTSQKVDLTISPSNATDKTVTWKSLNEQIAIVDNDGIITAKNIGETDVVAESSNGKKATIHVTVQPIKVTKIEVNQKDINVKQGDKVTLSATVYPENATDKTLQWSVQDPEIATIEEGTVVAKSTGKTKILCTSKDGIVEETEITIEPKEIIENANININTNNNEKLESNANNENLNGTNSSTAINTQLTGIALLITIVELISLVIFNSKLKIKDEKCEIKSIIGNVISWIFTVFCTLFIICSTSIIGLIFAILTSLSIAPPVSKFINKKSDKKIYTTKMKIIVFVILFIITMMLI